MRWLKNVIFGEWNEDDVSGGFLSNERNPPDVFLEPILKIDLTQRTTHTTTRMRHQ